MKRSLFAVLGLLSVAAHAGDPRIRTEVYSKDKVYSAYTAVGRATLIQLEEGESLNVSASSVLGIGDADAWNLGVRGNNIVLKPSQRMPQTNVVIVTNKRTYSFDLAPVQKDGMPTYILRFDYPDTEAAKQAAAAAAEVRRTQITSAAKAERVIINTSYVWRGANARLKPTSAWDDGRFTRLVYDHGGEMPVFFKVLPDGTEALLNYSTDAESRNTVLIHEVSGVMRARLGTEVIEIINKGYSLPKFNSSGAGVYGTVRVEKERS